jgi:hypothetical protein
MNHCTIKILGLLALLFLVSSPIKAQTHPCGGARAGNEVQVGEAPGGNGVAATPLCDWVNGNQPPVPQPPPQQWLDRWGAIATDFSHGSVGMVDNTPSQSGAENAAIADCHAKGGLTCKIEITYRNECAALVAGDKGHITRAGATPDAAIQAGLAKCREEDTNCKTYFTGCSTPVRIQ